VVYFFLRYFNGLIDNVISNVSGTNVYSISGDQGYENNRITEAYNICTTDIADDIINQAIEVIGTYYPTNLTVFRRILDLSSYIRTANASLD